MKFNKIYIRSFGKLHDISFSLGDGINVFEGENESGKSTLLAFIRFAFYGLPSRRSEEGVLEHERALSWDSGVADGYIEFTTPDGSYRIERRAVVSERGEGCVERMSVTDLSTHSIIKNIKDAGEHFFGVPLSVFDSTSAVRQQALAGINGTDISTSLENMLFSGDESTNTTRAIDKLTKAKRALRPLRGSGGTINELLAQRNELRRRLEEAKEAYKNVIMFRGRAERGATLCAELREKLNVAEDRLRAFETIQTLKRFDMLHAGEAKVASLEAELSKLVLESGYDGKLPDRKYVDLLDSISRRLSVAESEVARARGELAGTRSAQIGDTNLAARADDIDEAGDGEAIADKYAKMRKNATAKTVWGVLLIVFGVLIMSAALTVYFARLLPFVTMPMASGVTVGGFLLFVLGIALIPSGARGRRRALSYLFELGLEAEGAVTRAVIISHANACIEARRQINEFASLIGSLEQEYQKKLDAVSEIRAEALSALAEFGRTCAEDDLAESLAEAAEAASRTAKIHEKLVEDIEKYRNSVRESAARLEGENEASLRAHLSPSAVEMLAAANFTALKTERDEYAARLASAQERRIDAEKNLEVAERTSENPAHLASMLEEVESRLADAEARHDAIALAIESITSASETLRGNITPRLRAEASSLLSSMTGGRYSDFGIDGDYSISLMTESGTRGISALSSGTRDAAYFALRTSLCKMMYRKDMPPMMLDEALVQLDDGRATNLLSLLVEMSGESQIMIFTCHNREKKILTSLGAEHTLFTLVRDGKE